MHLSRVLISALAATILFSNIHGQDDDPIKVDSSIVRLNVGVVDGRGRPVTSLDSSSFSVFEDGVKQNVSRFETTTAPFSVVMLLDMSGSTKSYRPNIKLSASRFLDALAPDDRVAVIEFYSKFRLLNDFTVNKNVAARSIELANGQGDTDLYKAISFALEKLSKETNRRKAIVVLTDGVDTEARNGDRKFLSSRQANELATAIKPEANEDLARLLSRADQQAVTIYPLALPTGDPKRLADPTPMQFAMFDASRKRLQLIADRTGGTLNTINRLEEMGKLYALVAAELRTLYSVEYTPANSKRDGKWRAISVSLNTPELIARTRQGYFAK